MVTKLSQGREGRAPSLLNMATLTHIQHPLLPLRFPRKRLEVKTADFRGLDRQLRTATLLGTRSEANRGPQSLSQFPQNVRGSASSSPTVSSKYTKVGQCGRQAGRQPL